MTTWLGSMLFMPFTVRLLIGFFYEFLGMLLFLMVLTVGCGI